MWEADFSILGKREASTMEDTPTEHLEEVSHSTKAEANTGQQLNELRRLILEAPPTQTIATPSVPASMPPLLSINNALPQIPPALIQPPTQQLSTSKALVPTLPRTAGPDPSWKPFQHAGILREIGGLRGWYDVFVHKTHVLPNELK